MSRITWDERGERLYETGIDRVVIYRSNTAEGWNGVTAVNEGPSGGEASKLYADNGVYLSRTNAEEAGLTVEAFDYPESFESALGRTQPKPGVFIEQQDRKHFGLCYRSLIGNDTAGNKFGYIINIAWDCLASPSEQNHETVNDSADIDPNSWEITITPVNCDGHDPTSILRINSVKMSKAGLKNVLWDIENILYGTDETNPRIPSISELLELVEICVNILDSNGDIILDSDNEPLVSFVS